MEQAKIDWEWSPFTAFKEPVLTLLLSIICWFTWKPKGQPASYYCGTRPTFWLNCEKDKMNKSCSKLSRSHWITWLYMALKPNKARGYLYSGCDDQMCEVVWAPWMYVWCCLTCNKAIYDDILIVWEVLFCGVSISCSGREPSLICWLLGRNWMNWIW